MAFLSQKEKYKCDFKFILLPGLSFNLAWMICADTIINNLEFNTGTMKHTQLEKKNIHTHIVNRVIGHLFTINICMI